MIKKRTQKYLEVSTIFQIAIVVCALFSAWKWGDWGNFDKYYPTLLFLIVTNFIYKLIAINHFHLWKWGDGLGNHTLVYFIYVFLVFVPAIFTYLSTYPISFSKQVLHIAKWVAIFTIIEWVGLKYLNVINHHNGWNIWWSFGFNIVMFLMLRLHFKRYKLALLLSVPCTLFLLFWFDYI